MKIKYPAKDTEEIVYKIFDDLIDYTSRFTVVGSLGRKESEVGDIDILVIPTDIPGIRRKLGLIGAWNRGGDRFMAVDNVYDSPFGLDLFLCHPPAQWGVLTAVRLNPIPLVIYGKKKIDEQGYERKGGGISLDGVPLRLPKEEDWFKLVGIPYVPVTERWELVEKLGLTEEDGA